MSKSPQLSLSDKGPITQQEAATASPVTTAPPPASQEAGGASSLAKALCQVQARMKTVTMSGENKFDKYSYAKLVDYIDVCRKPISDCGLSVLFSVAEVVPLEDRSTKGGAVEHAVRVHLFMTITHISGEQITLNGWGEGQDRADKAIYKAITGARKYLLGMALNLASGEEDPESTEREPEIAMDAADLRSEITQLAIRDRMTDEQITRCYTELTGEIFPIWRSQKEPVLWRIYRGWAKLVAKADELDLRQKPNMTRVKTIPNDETGDGEPEPPATLL